MENIFKPNPGEHVLLMLVDGATIIGVLETRLFRDSNDIDIGRPLRLDRTPVRMPNGEVGTHLSIADYIPQDCLGANTPKSISFKKEHIMLWLEPSAQIVAAHIKITSGIEVAPAGAEKRIKIAST